MQKNALDELKRQSFDCTKSLKMIDLYLSDLTNKIKDLDSAIVDEKLYYNTMPQSIYLEKKA